MITSAKKMRDYLDIQNIKQSILAIGSGELAFWKRAVAADEELFNLLFKLIFSGDQRLAWRSCWIIDNASEDSPDLLADKLPEIIDGFLSTSNGSLKRHFTRILCRYQIPEEYLGAIVNRSFELLAPYEPIAVRVFALQLLFNISLLVPDLKGELIPVIESLMDEGASAGFINRSAKLLRQLRS
jgi:hypothetical protein